MKIKCGDANPNGNVWMFAKGGCGKEVELKDAYRCTGCGVFFHLDCIFNHFEMEKGADYARNALKKIFDHITITTTRGGKPDENKILKLAVKGLDRKPKARRLKI